MEWIKFKEEILQRPDTPTIKMFPVIGYLICEKCGEHLGYFGGNGDDVDSARNSQLITKTKDRHRQTHYLQALTEMKGGVS